MAKDIANKFVLLAMVLTFLVGLVTHDAEAAKDPPPCNSPKTEASPFKTVSIRNNTDNPIWVVLETAKQDLLDESKPRRRHDRWLQAEFKPTPGTYASLYLYRTYVNPTAGIPKKSSVKLIVPFYTQLEKKPDRKSTRLNSSHLGIS